MFTIHNLTVKRPGSGLSPMKFNKIIGKPAKKNFSYDAVSKAYKELYERLI